MSGDPHVLDSKAMAGAMSRIAEHVVRRLEVVAHKRLCVAIFVWDADGGRFVSNCDEAKTDMRPTRC